MKNLIKKWRKLNDFTKTLVTFVLIILSLISLVLMILYCPEILIIVPVGMIIFYLWQLAKIISGTDNFNDDFY